MSEELVVIATSYDIVEAEFLRNHLEEQGFEVYLADENVVSMYNFLAPAIGGIKIKVLESESVEAKKFVEDLQNAEIVYDENFPEGSDS